MHDNINRGAGLLFRIRRGDAAGGPHCKMDQSTQSVSRAVGMKGCDGPMMDSVQCVQEDPWLCATNLAYGDPVGPMRSSALSRSAKSILLL